MATDDDNDDAELFSPIVVNVDDLAPHIWIKFGFTWNIYIAFFIQNILFGAIDSEVHWKLFWNEWNE